MPPKRVPLTHEAEKHQKELLLQQAVNLPLPPLRATETLEDHWSNDEKLFLQENYDYYKKMISFLESARITGSFSKVPKPPKRKLQDFLSMKN